MKRFLFLSVLLALVAGAFWTTPAKAAPFLCDSSTVIDGQSIPGHLQVAAAQHCEIVNSTIGGNVILGNGSSVQVGSSRIGGSVKALNNPLYVRLGAADPVRIGGSVAITGVTGPQSFICNDTTIGGNVTLTKNGGDGVDVGSPALCANSGPIIRGKISILKNSGDMNLERTRPFSATVKDNCGGGTVMNNGIFDSLTVLRNEPDYTVSGNIVNGPTNVNQTGAPVGCP